MKTIKDTLKKFREEFPQVHKYFPAKFALTHGRSGSYTNCEVEIEQFISTEFKELLKGLKGRKLKEIAELSSEEKAGGFNSMHRIAIQERKKKMYGYNQREQKLRKDIDKILK